MKWIASLTLFCALAGAVLAGGPDDQYLDIYSQILQADGLRKAGQTDAAADMYFHAQDALQKMHAEHPSWNKEIVDYRLEYVAAQIKALGRTAPSAPAQPAAAATNGAPLTPEQQLASWREQTRLLSAANAELSAKLKEALSVQPAGTDPRDLANARETILQLQKDKDLLTVALDQEKAKKSAPASSSSADSGSPKPAKELAALKERSAKDAKAAQSEISRLKDELAKSEQKLAEAKKELDAKPSRSKSASGQELDRLRARIAVLEANPVPFSPEELAVLNGSPSAKPATPPETTAPRKPVQLPAGTGALMEEARQAVQNRDYNQAERKFGDVLAQDESNVYVRVNLANAEYAAGHLDSCETNVQRALQLDGQDPGALYLLGILRYRQNKLDEALDALSRSAQLNSTNAGTQNYLGCVLSDKGLRPAAETAFRKSLALDPGYADAHFNLALVYAGDKPPSLALARYHYQKALALGHANNEALEKQLGWVEYQGHL